MNKATEKLLNECLDFIECAVGNTSSPLIRRRGNELTDSIVATLQKAGAKQAERPRYDARCEHCQRQEPHSMRMHEASIDDHDYGYQFDADCPACLRGITHTKREHEQAIRRNNESSGDDWFRSLL